MNSQFDEDYFIRGTTTGKSLYENYRWLPELTIPMAKAIVKHCGITKEDVILDFGCARGYLVRALRELDYNACGCDTSKWAIENCDDKVSHFVTCDINDLPDVQTKDVDWVIAKDVMEHIENVKLWISNLMDLAKKGLFVVVPLSAVDRVPYVVREYEMDVTHLHRFTLSTWASMFMTPGWEVSASYRVPGVKNNYSYWTIGNGFITCRRIEE